VRLPRSRLAGAAPSDDCGGVTPCSVIGSVATGSGKVVHVVKELIFGEADTLGGRYGIRPEHAVCEPKDGVLQVRETRTFPADSPLLPSYVGG